MPEAKGEGESGGRKAVSQRSGGPGDAVQQKVFPLKAEVETRSSPKNGRIQSVAEVKTISP